jgi:hypothetical protein
MVVSDARVRPGKPLALRGAIRNALRAAFSTYPSTESMELIDSVANDDGVSQHIRQIVLAGRKGLRKATLWQLGAYLFWVFVPTSFAAIHLTRNGLVGTATGLTWKGDIRGGELLAVSVLFGSVIFALKYLAKSQRTIEEDWGRVIATLNLCSASDVALALIQEPASISRRDELAIAIEFVADKNRRLLGRSTGPRQHSRRVRALARSYQETLLGMLPCIAAPEHSSMTQVREDLARLAIRTATGFWYQFDDIGQQRPPAEPRGKFYDAVHAIRSILSEPAVQVALITGLFAVVVAVFSLLGAAISAGTK